MNLNSEVYRLAAEVDKMALDHEELKKECKALARQFNMEWGQIYNMVRNKFFEKFADNP